MKPSTLRRLPATFVGSLHTHPEPHHLNVLYQMACRCGPAPLFVEHGPTNGAVTLVLLTAMLALPGSELVLLGEPSDAVIALIQASALQERVVFVLPPRRKPSLWFIGRPEFAAVGVEQAEALDSRVIIVYDSRTSERFGYEQFVPNALAAKRLMANKARGWSSLCDALTGQQTRRGMLIAELRRWSPEIPADAEEVPEHKLEAAPKPATASRFQFPRLEA